MNIWTLVTELGDGTGSITNNHPNYNLYGGTFVYVGETTPDGDYIYTTCSLFKPQIDSSGADWEQGHPSVVSPGFIPSANNIIECMEIEPCCKYPPSFGNIIIPRFTNVDASWSFFNWNPEGYPEGVSVTGSINGYTLFLSNEPYENNWDTLASGNQNINEWYNNDLIINNQLTARGVAPILDVSNKEIVFSATGGFRNSGGITSSTIQTYYILFKINNLNNDDQVLLQLGDTTVTGSIDIRYKSSTSRIEATFNYDGGLTTSVSTSLSDSNWHLVCVIIDSENSLISEQFKIYLDNVEGSTNNNSLLSVPTIGGTIYIGGNVSEIWSFEGSIRMIRINNQVDTIAERRRLFNRVQYLQSIT